MPPGRAVAEDRSGRSIAGRASFYGRQFNGRRMADRRRFRPESNAAASKVLPLGTTARVTNLATGRTATVRVEDRGPYVQGRVVDLSPATAAQIGLGKREGLAPVVVAPVSVPQPDGSVKLGAGAAELYPSPSGSASSSR
ncbi:MAG: septal ring lytic transglycosylase RlpA family protein [Acidisphaera sp.]|nr:septal ring lytic transglycosylase RlpA family protein [Acidisphaera sp.]